MWIPTRLVDVVGVAMGGFCKFFLVQLLNWIENVTNDEQVCGY